MKEKWRRGEKKERVERRRERKGGGNANKTGREQVESESWGE